LARIRDLEKLATEWFGANKLTNRLLAEARFYLANAEGLVLRLSGTSIASKDAMLANSRLRCETARIAYDGMWQLFLDGRAYPEWVYDWSSNLGSAVADLPAGPNDGKKAAAQDHLSRMNSLRKLVREKYHDIPVRWRLGCEFYVADAEIDLSRVTSK